MRHKRLMIASILVVMLLLIPLIAMLFTEEVSWTVSDFAVAGVLLFATAFACELVLRKVRKIHFRIAICVVILVTLILIWSELAVGIFGTLLNG